MAIGASRPADVSNTPTRILRPWSEQPPEGEAAQRRDTSPPNKPAIKDEGQLLP